MGVGCVSSRTPGVWRGGQGEGGTEMHMEEEGTVCKRQLILTSDLVSALGPWDIP